MSVVPTKDGYLLQIKGKTFRVTHEQLRNNPEIAAAVGYTVLSYIIQANEPSKRRAFLYHNAEEAGIACPRKVNSKRQSKE